MRLHRFYLNKKIEGDQIFVEDKDLLYQWQKVFRFKPFDKVIVFNGTSFEYMATFELISRGKAVLKITEKREIKNDQKLSLHIFQSIIKKDNFEFVVQKCTEIGATAFHPILSERSEKKDLNLERLNKIAKEASEQSGRLNIPTVFTVQELKNSNKDFKGKFFVLDFDGKNIGDVELSGDVGILIGPEGGWSDSERLWFKEQNIVSLSLGKQILRAETAAVSLSAMVLLNK